MIARIKGILDGVEEGKAVIDLPDGLTYEVLVMSCDVERLTRKAGQEVVLHTIHYLEGDPSHGVQSPRLVGFLSPTDRQFFRLFTTVKGIGFRKALRALARPPGEVAAAILNKDTKFLVALPEIGRRTAETIIVDLSGKVDDWASGGFAATPEGPVLSSAAAEALAVLTQLGERRSDAQAIIERVLAVAPELDTTEDIIRQAYHLKTAGR